jgi:hypothetical protein
MNGAKTLPTSLKNGLDLQIMTSSAILYHPP